MLISLSAFNFGCNCRAFLKPLQMANDILMRYFVEKEPRHHFIIITRKIPKHWKKNSTINVRSHGRSQRHCIGGETKGTEIKRFILRREGGASLNQGGVRATPWSKPLAWKTLHKLWMCIVYVRCTWVPIDVMLHHNWMLWMSTASLGFVRCERNPHEPQDGFVQTLLSRVDLKGARRLMTAWDKNVNFVELLKEDSLLEIETDIFTFSALSNSFSDTQW